MIMVRRTELACRDDWSRSLWQPASGAQDEVEPQYSRSPLTGPLPPTSQRDLSSLIAQDIISTGVSGEDVLLSEARIISEPPESKNRWESPARAIEMPNFDPRTAIFRAREAYRDKVKAKATEARMMSGAEPLAESFHEPVSTTPQGLELALGYEQAQPNLHLPETSPAIEKRPAIETAHAALAPAAASVVATRSTAVEKLRPNRNTMQNGLGSSDNAHNLAPISEPTIASAVPESARLSLPLRRVNGVASIEMLPAPDLPEWYRTDLPRVCRTCRDYRPSTDGQRGWCANSWAFTHRRLVQSDDLTPCHSAIGDWWAPVDDVWLVAADVSSHGRATPHLDRVAGQETGRRRRS